VGSVGRWHDGDESVLQPPNRSGVELRDTRLIDANLSADLLHRRFLVVVKADQLLLACGQRGDRGADMSLGLIALVECVGLLRLRRHEDRRKRRFAKVLVLGQRRSRFDRVDPHDRSTKSLFVRPDLGGEIGQRRFASQLAPELLARRLELPALPANPSRPRVLP